MFKKVHDRMFRKAQMKLFLMIVGILLAVFIALIVGINLITKTVMEGQSKEVLQEIAADIDYDEKHAKFTFKSQEDPKNGKENAPPPKPSESSDVTSSAGTTAAPSETDPQTTEDGTGKTDASTEADIQPSETQSDTAPDTSPDTQPTDPNTEEYTWFAIPTFPEGVTMPTMPNNENTGWNDWNKNGWGDQNGQNWNSGAYGYGGYGGSQDWSQWNNQSGGQSWNSWGGQSSSQSGSQDWGGQNWNSWTGQGGSQSDTDFFKGWKWVDNQWKNDDGRVWDGKGVPPWFEVTVQEDGKNADWWNNNPYNMWLPNNPFNPMNPDNPYTQKYSEKDYSKRESGKSDEDDEVQESTYESKQYNSDISIDPEENEGAVIAQTAGDGEYQIVQLADSSTGSHYSAQKKQEVEVIPKNIGTIDFFVMMADTNGKYLATINNDDIVSTKAEVYTNAIINDRHDTGYINSYQYYKASKPNGTIMVLTDKSDEKNVLMQLKRTTIIAGLIALIILSVLAYFLSKMSIQPIKIAFDKQKQFVSDASHELKTPLTVISTNADVLEGEIGDNKWLGYIKSQTDRMSVLVNDLLNLTRLENSNNELERRYFNLSKAIANTALPFECRAFESNKKFEVNIEDNIMLNGSEKHIKQMAAIFIDNALKYSNDGGTVQVTLKRSGDRKLFSVYNTGDGIKENDTEKIFERFYRSDESRNRATGGYGLGLAIAKSVADKHKFKIHVLNQPGKGVCFIVTM